VWLYGFVVPTLSQRTRKDGAPGTWRFYDFNVWSAHKHREKLRYIHRNPVKRGLVETPDQWRWSSCRAYAFREIGPIVVNDWSAVKMKTALRNDSDQSEKPHPFDFAQGRLSHKKREKWGTLRSCEGERREVGHPAILTPIAENSPP